LVFQEICADIKLVNRDLASRADAAGVESVFIELLVLGSIRVIASGCTFDAVEELTNVHQESHRVFFHEQFCKWGDRASSVHIKIP